MCLALLPALATPAAAQNREHLQLAAELRMLQEQNQQLSLALDATDRHAQGRQLATRHQRRIPAAAIRRPGSARQEPGRRSRNHPRAHAGHGYTAAHVEGRDRRTATDVPVSPCADRAVPAAAARAASGSEQSQLRRCTPTGWARRRRGPPPAPTLPLPAHGWAVSESSLSIQRSATTPRRSTRRPSPGFQQAHQELPDRRTRR